MVSLCHRSPYIAFERFNARAVSGWDLGTHLCYEHRSAVLIIKTASQMQVAPRIVGSTSWSRWRQSNTATDWPKCFCIYRLKCSKAISGWLDGRTEISGKPYSKSTAVLIMQIYIGAWFADKFFPPLPPQAVPPGDLWEITSLRNWEIFKRSLSWLHLCLAHFRFPRPPKCYIYPQHQHFS